MKNKLLLTLLIFFLNLKLFSQQTFYPVYITGSGVPINEYNLFANSGWDGNWYVGANMCWIKKFNKENFPPKELYSKFYVGVKLGRAKTQPKPFSPPWEKQVIDGNIYIGVSSTPAWKSDQRYFLCKIADIPTEGDDENAINTTGEARWFYTNIPIEKVDFTQDVWICVYSNTPYLTSASSSPILAGAWRERQQVDFNVWLNTEINGAPPIDPATSLKTQIRAFDPAIIIKLVPKDAEKLPVKIYICRIVDGRKENDEKVFYLNTETPNLERVWMEISVDKINYVKLSRYCYSLPYAFHLNIPMIPQEINGDFYIRFAAEDIFGNRGYTEELQLNITRPQQTESSVDKDKQKKDIKKKK
ncbi:MAG: hypothetical protein NZ839_02380 [Endomicrobia bacterium]|nr:hypothetical protein [Endomicrobiia bacterium]